MKKFLRLEFIIGLGIIVISWLVWALFPIISPVTMIIILLPIELITIFIGAIRNGRDR